VSTEIRATFIGITVPAGTPNFLIGPVITQIYDRIRILAVETPGSTSPVDIMINLVDGDDFHTVGQLDTLNLKPGSQVTNVYEIPGTFIDLYATATGKSGTSAVVTIYVYGSPIASTSTDQDPSPAPSPPTPIKVIPDPIKVTDPGATGKP
jgi:hypothetical protein